MIELNSTMEITKNKTDNSSMIFFTVIKGGLIVKNPNTIENGLDNVAHNASPLRNERGPNKKEHKRDI